MQNVFRNLTILSALACGLALQSCSRKVATSNTREHIRGTIQSLDGGVLIVAASAGAVPVQLSSSTLVATVVASDRAHIQDGSFLGITSVKGSDGSQRAVEVHVFPEAMRGTGEGSYGWDWSDVSQNSKMTNGTASKMTNGTAVASKMTNGSVSRSMMTNGAVRAQPGGSSLMLQYKDGTSGGSQKITIPPGTPVVALELGKTADLQFAAHVFVIASRDPHGLLAAERVLVGKNGLVPPM